MFLYLFFVLVKCTIPGFLIQSLCAETDQWVIVNLSEVLHVLICGVAQLVSTDIRKCTRFLGLKVLFLFSLLPLAVPVSTSKLNTLVTKLHEYLGHSSEEENCEVQVPEISHGEWCCIS